MADLETARAAKRVLAARLANDDRVSGVGITGNNGNYAVKVNVVDANDRPALPEEIEGAPVEIRIVGHVRALG